MSASVRILRDKQVVEPAKAIIADCKQAVPEVNEHQTFFHVVYSIRPIMSIYEWAKARRPLLVDKKAWPNYDSMVLARKDLNSFNSRSGLGFEIVQLDEPWNTLEGKLSRAYFLNVALEEKIKRALALLAGFKKNIDVGFRRKEGRLTRTLAHRVQKSREAYNLDAQIKRAIARGRRGGRGGLTP